MRQQQTIAAPLELNGVGIHTGTQVRMRLIPSEQGGILFRRVDLDGMEFPIDAQETNLSKQHCFAQCRTQASIHRTSAGDIVCL